MPRSKTYLASLRFFLLFLFVAYYGNNSFFYHTHVVDGKLITHSHFFVDFFGNEDQPVESHTHSSQEDALIQAFNQNSITDAVETIQLTATYFLISPFENPFSKKDSQETTYSNRSLRAPPQA